MGRAAPAGDLARVGRTLRQQMQPNEFAPPSLPVAVYANRKGRNENGHAAGIDVDSVGIAAVCLVYPLDRQRVVPCPQHTAMLMGPDRLGWLVDVDDFDGVPVGGYDVEREQPSGATLTGTQWLGSSCQRGNSKEAFAYVKECDRRLHCPPY